RGISQSLKNRLFRETVVAQNEFLYSYSVRGNDGKVESFYTHEFYFLTGQNGLVVFLNYPENLREKAKEIEESIKNSIKMK
ncbi:MAG: hypothetical protein KDK45_21395, partial [Leptospiraceae bacterium]|nr:hypothetical protein [Leptospiraceae bacterium]